MSLHFALASEGPALVTGGSRGIGAAAVLALARAGFDVWLNYRDDEVAAARVAERVASDTGRRCRLLRFDVRDADAVRERLGPLLEEEVPAVVVNNAGIIRDGLFVLMPWEDWRDVLETTLTGFFNVTRTVLEGMLLRRRGRIVNVSSTSGLSGLPGQVNYAAAKAGLIGATKALALEVARRNVLVNAIAPGLVETDMTRDVPVEQILPSIPLRRVGSVEEIAGVVVFLCSDEASYMTGEVIACNGGLRT